MISSQLPGPSQSRRESILSSSSSAVAAAVGQQTGMVPSGSGQSDLFRHRNKKRDDAIRKKAETELSRKATSKRMSTASMPAGSMQPPSFNKRSKGYSNTVASLKPAQAITVLETARIVQAAQLMAAKRADAVLVVNEEGQLSGILTDKDIAYRVVAEGLDLRQTTVAQCMTRNPIAVLDKGPRNEALSTMVSRRFRHLPVIAADEDEGMDAEMGSTATSPTSTNVVGLLDITKCVFERLDDLERKVLEDANIVAAMEALERRGHLDGEQVGVVRTQHGCPDLHSVLSKNDSHGGDDVPEVGVKASVRDAARIMKQYHQTAVLVLAQGEEKLHGIFTTKDIVLRVIAAGLDPATTSVVRVMTPHPDSVDSSTTILEALKKLHVGHYLHLPVVEDEMPVGLVDVLTLTMAMLDYLMNKETAAFDSAVPENPEVDPSSVSGPMWNKFWNSAFNTNNSSNLETESTADSLDSNNDLASHKSLASSNAAPLSRHPARESLISPRQYRQSIQINNLPDRFSPPPQHYVQSPSLVRESPQPYPPPPASTILSGGASSLDVSQFGYKLRDKRSGKVHRFTSSSTAVAEVYAAIRAKIGGTLPPASAVSYEDEEGDLILLGSNADLEEAVGMARRFGWERLVLHVGDAAAAAPSAAAASEKTKSPERAVAATQRRQGNASEGSVSEFLRDAPLAVNVAISAGIVVMAAFVITRMGGSVSRFG